VENVCTRGRRYQNLAAGRHPDICVEILRLDLKFGNRIERNSQPDIFLFRLVEDARSIHTVEQKIVVVKAVASEADLALIAGTVVDSAWR
jgi:hypothetical protein